MTTTKQYLSVLESAKAYVAGAAALVTTLATTLLAIYGPETTIGQVLTVAVAVAGALTTFLATYKTPNAVATSVTTGDTDEDVEQYIDGHGPDEA